jgi:hypothetical protein
MDCHSKDFADEFRSELEGIEDKDDFDYVKNSGHLRAAIERAYVSDEFFYLVHGVSPVFGRIKATACALQAYLRNELL